MECKFKEKEGPSVFGGSTHAFGGSTHAFEGLTDSSLVAFQRIHLNESNYFNCLFCHFSLSVHLAFVLFLLFLCLSISSPFPSLPPPLLPPVLSLLIAVRCQGSAKDSWNLAVSLCDRGRGEKDPISIPAGVCCDSSTLQTQHSAQTFQQTVPDKLHGGQKGRFT